MKYSVHRNGRGFGLPKWQLVALLAVAASLGLAIAIVATGVFLIALPIVAVIVLGYRLFGGPRRDRARPGVIDAEYEVVESAGRSTPRGPGRR